MEAVETRTGAVCGTAEARRESRSRGAIRRQPPQRVAAEPQPGPEFRVARQVLAVPGPAFIREPDNLLTSRTAVVRTRMPGGVGGGSIPPYPDFGLLAMRQTACSEQDT